MERKLLSEILNQVNKADRALDNINKLIGNEESISYEEVFDSILVDTTKALTKDGYNPDYINDIIFTYLKPAQYKYLYHDYSVGGSDWYLFADLYGKGIENTEYSCATLMRMVTRLELVSNKLHYLDKVSNISTSLVRPLWDDLEDEACSWIETLLPGDFKVFCQTYRMQIVQIITAYYENSYDYDEYYECARNQEVVNATNALLDIFREEQKPQLI